MEDIGTVARILLEKLRERPEVKKNARVGRGERGLPTLAVLASWEEEARELVMAKHSTEQLQQRPKRR